MSNPYIKEYRTDGSNELLNTFFSEDNIQYLQVGLITTIKQKTNILIGPQSKMDLINFMHKIYKVNANTLCPQSLSKELEILNRAVINECVPNILFNMKSYNIYMKDISTTPMPLDRGISTNIDKSLEFTNIFGHKDSIESVKIDKAVVIDNKFYQDLVNEQYN